MMTRQNEYGTGRLKAVEIMRQATDLLMAGYSSTPGMDSQREALLQTSSKSSIRDLVTRYDKEVEKFLSTQLQKQFPGEAVFGEEGLAKSGRSLKDSVKPLKSFWLIDPIDGTKNYCRAYPYFCSTMAYIEKQNDKWIPVVGITFDPVRNEMFSASFKGGAFLNEQILKVSAVKGATGALFSSGFAAARVGHADHAFSTFRKVSEGSLGVCRGGSAALDLAYVAAGRIDGYWERGLDTWDIAAGVLLLTEAGGNCSHYNNQELDLFSGEIVATNTFMHDWLTNLLLK